MLNLPIQAALVLFLAIDLLCKGLRNLLSPLLACVLTVLVSRGLPSKRVDNVQTFAINKLAPVNFTFCKASVLAVFFCTLRLVLLITLAGIGLGMRNSAYMSARISSAGNSLSTGKTLL